MPALRQADPARGHWAPSPLLLRFLPRINPHAPELRRLEASHAMIGGRRSPCETAACRSGTSRWMRQPLRRPRWYQSGLGPTHPDIARGTLCVCPGRTSPAMGLRGARLATVGRFCCLHEQGRGRIPTRAHRGRSDARVGGNTLVARVSGRHSRRQTPRRPREVRGTPLNRRVSCFR